MFCQQSPWEPAKNILIHVQALHLAQWYAGMKTNLGGKKILFMDKSKILQLRETNTFQNTSLMDSHIPINH